MKFRATIRNWRPERKSGLAVAGIPIEHIAPLGGLTQLRVQNMINSAEYVSKSAGSGRLALGVSQKVMAATGVGVGDKAEFETDASHKHRTRAEHRGANPRLHALDDESRDVQACIALKNGCGWPASA